MGVLFVVSYSGCRVMDILWQRRKSGDICVYMAHFSFQLLYVACRKVAATYRDHFSVVCPSRNYSRCNINQTLQELSVSSLVVHIVSILQFNYFWQSYYPLMIFIFKACGWLVAPVLAHCNGYFDRTTFGWVTVLEKMRFVVSSKSKSVKSCPDYSLETSGAISSKLYRNN